MKNELGPLREELKEFEDKNIKLQHNFAELLKEKNDTIERMESVQKYLSQIEIELNDKDQKLIYEKQSLAEQVRRV